MAVKKGGLGRGLESLFSENSVDNGGAVNIRLSDIEPNKEQPRRDFSDEALNELADSISKHGLIQPIIVRPQANGSYRIIAGERRWRACRMAGLQEVPVVIKEVDDKTLMELALIENLQREDLNAVEEALGYRSLIDTYNLTQEQVAESVGKSRSTVTNALRLLNLSVEELEALRQGVISPGHARTLLSVEGDLRDKMFALARDGASVRELERLAKTSPAKKSKTPKLKDSFYSEVELSLKNEMHRRVTVKGNNKGAGTITLEFFSKEELKDFARRLSEE